MNKIPSTSGFRALPTRLLCAALVAATLGFSGCAPLIVGGAMAGGSMVAIDRRTSGTQLEDEGIELLGLSRISDALSSSGHVNVTSYNRQVLLTGEVASDKDKLRAGEVASRVDNVRSVINELAVMEKSSLTQRSQDALITGKVKASMVDAKDLQSNAFKVVTERGIVYMMGRVTQREATRATEVVRGISGVNKVVRAFEIISEQELANLMPPPKSATAGEASK